MICPKCKGKTRILEGAVNIKADETYRKRVCTKCRHIFYTVEFPVEENDTFKGDYEEAKQITY